MLFDLSGKRRRVVQVVYATLAILMGGSLVLFGIGSDAPGGILDAVGLGGNGTGASSPQYDEEIEDAESRLEANPQDERALLDLAHYRFLAATGSGIETDQQTGVVSVSEDARQDLEESVAAWEQYLDTNPKRPNASGATDAAQAYRYLNDADGAAAAQEIVAESQQTAAAYYQLALFRYADGQIKAGDEAGQQAIEVAEEADRKRITQIVEQLAEQARKQKEQLAKAEKQAEEAGGGAGGAAEQQVQDPFGALGGGTGAPTTPAP
jgi:tetratricopeptide (TPR) repeat protein